MLEKGLDDISPEELSKLEVEFRNYPAPEQKERTVGVIERMGDVYRRISDRVFYWMGIELPFS